MLLTDLLTLECAGTDYDVFLVVDDGVEFLSRDTEERSHLGRQGAEIPYMGYGHNEFDMTHALAAHFLLGDLNSASFAYDAFITDTLVLTAMALEILGRTEDALAEQTIALRFIGTIVDSFRFEHLSGRALHNLIGGSETNRDLGETGFLIFLFKSHFESS